MSLLSFETILPSNCGCARTLRAAIRQPRLRSGLSGLWRVPLTVSVRPRFRPRHRYSMRLSVRPSGRAMTRSCRSACWISALMVAGRRSTFRWSGRCKPRCMSRRRSARISASSAITLRRLRGTAHRPEPTEWKSGLLGARRAASLQHIAANREATVDSFLRAARALIDENGADVIIPQGITRCPVLLKPDWLSAQLGVPVVEGIGAPIRMAALLVSLGLKHSRVRWAKEGSQPK